MYKDLTSSNANRLKADLMKNWFEGERK